MTPEIAQARIGYITASQMWRVLAKGEGLTREDYMYEIIDERVLGISADGYTSAAMQAGTDNEQYAIAFYEVSIGVLVDPGRFVPHPTIPMFGATPDGFVGGDGLIECKCPQGKTYNRFLAKRKIDRKYQIQMQTQLACTERSWCDYVIYSAAHNTGEIVRVERDEEMIATIEAAAIALNEEIDTFISNHYKK